MDQKHKSKGPGMKQVIDAMQGQLHAFSVVLTAIIQEMPVSSAARTCVLLREARVNTLKQDQEVGTPECEATTRDAILVAYLELLTAVAKSPSPLSNE